MQRFFTAFLYILLFLLSFQAYAAQSENVLVIHSYQLGFFWTDAIDAGIRRGFRASGGNYELFVESYDTKRFTPAERDAPFTEYLKQKYRHTDFSALIVSDDSAYQFVIEHRDDLFRNIPVVFCGLNHFDIYSADLPPGVTGVAEDFDVAANLKLIASLHGKHTLVAVVTDSTTSGFLNLGLFARAAEDETAPPLQFEILADLTEKELHRRLGMLPEDSVILNLGFWRDHNGKSLSYQESISLMVDSGFPVYTCWDQAIRYGTLGGIALDVGLQGEYAADYALKILHGARPEDLPVKRNNLSRPIFNYQALKKFDISRRSLPPHSEIYNLPNSIYYRYPVAFRITLASFIILSGLILLLVLNIVSRKQTETLFRSLVENAPDVIFVHDREGRILLVNKAVERYHGYSVEEAGRLTLADFDTPAHAKTLSSRISDVLSGIPRKDEILHTAKDGQLLEFESSAVRVSYHGRPAVLAILRNIDERNRTRRTLEKTAREKEVLLKEIHHRVKNNLQVIASLLHLQADNTDDTNGAKTLEESQLRINAIATVHELLYETDNMDSIDAREYLENLTSQLISAHEDNLKEIRCSSHIDELELNIDQAVPVGIIVTELISNSLKYGMQDGICSFEIRLTKEGNDLVLKQKDSGRGFDFLNRPRTTLGLELVETLTKQLDGTLIYNGSGYTIRFRKK